MLEIQILTAFLTSLGVVGVGAEMLLRGAEKLLAPTPVGPPMGAKAWGLGVIQNMVWLAIGSILFQEGIWLAYLFLK